jgi:hypothetical protein
MRPESVTSNGAAKLMSVAEATGAATHVVKIRKRKRSFLKSGLHGTAASEWGMKTFRAGRLSPIARVDVAQMTRMSPAWKWRSMSARRFHVKSLL